MKKVFLPILGIVAGLTINAQSLIHQESFETDEFPIWHEFATEVVAW